jgi:hypothetical protein
MPHAIQPGASWLILAATGCISIALAKAARPGCLTLGWVGFTRLEPRPTGTGCHNSRLRLRPCRLRLERPESSTSDTAADCRGTAHFAVYCWRQRPVCACRALGGGKTCPPLRRFVPARGGRNLRSRSFLAVYSGCNLCRPPRTYVDLGFVGPTCPMCIFEQLLAPTASVTDGRSGSCSLPQNMPRLVRPDPRPLPAQAGWLEKAYGRAAPRAPENEGRHGMK